MGSRGRDPDTVPPAQRAAKESPEAARLQQLRSPRFYQPRIAPGVLNALVIVKPETVIRWHRAGFRLFWRWISRRPRAALEIRRLIRDMSLANPLWARPGSMANSLGIDIGRTSVAKYMARRRTSPSQGWKTFLRNHADGIASMDLFVVPTLLVSAALWLADSMPRPAPDLMAGCDSTPDRRMAGPATHRSLRLGMDIELHRPRS
jgi:hypothetical protein